MGQRADLSKLTPADLLDHYREDLQWCVIPAKEKAPVGKWKRFQERLPTEKEHAKTIRHVEGGGNAFLVCGPVSGGVAVLDLDTQDAVELWRERLGGAWDGIPKASSPSGGFHLFFRSADPVRNAKGEGWDLRASGGGVVLPSGNGKRKWITVPETGLPPFELIKGHVHEKVDTAQQQGLNGGQPRRVPEGERHTTLTSLAGSMRRQGMSPASVLSALVTENEERCDPPLPRQEIEGIARSAQGWPSGHEQKVEEELGRLRVRREARRRLRAEDSSVENFVLTDLAAAREEAKREIDWVIPDLLAAGEKGVIAGPPKSLKTWFALHLSRAITTGEAVLGESGWKPLQQPVLFAQEEGNAQRWARRVTGALDGDAPFFYLHRSGFSLLNEGHVAWLTERVDEVGARVVFLDPLQRITPGVNENDASEVGEAWNAIHGIAAHTEAAVLVIHHARKGEGSPTMDSIRGSSRVAGEVDLMFVLRRVERGALELYLDGRDLPPRAESEQGNLGISYEADQPHEMKISGVLTVRINRTRDAIVAVLQEAGQPLTTSRIEKEVAGRLAGKPDRSTILRHLRSLSDVKKDEGGNGKAAKWRWAG